MRYLMIVLLGGGLLLDCARECTPPPAPPRDAGTDAGSQWCYTPYRAHGGPVHNVCFATRQLCEQTRIDTRIMSSECFIGG